MPKFSLGVQLDEFDWMNYHFLPLFAINWSGLIFSLYFYRLLQFTSHWFVISQIILWLLYVALCFSTLLVLFPFLIGIFLYLLYFYNWPLIFKWLIVDSGHFSISFFFSFADFLLIGYRFCELGLHIMVSLFLNECMHTTKIWMCFAIKISRRDCCCGCSTKEGGIMSTSLC